MRQNGWEMEADELAACLEKLFENATGEDIEDLRARKNKQMRDYVYIVIDDVLWRVNRELGIKIEINELGKGFPGAVDDIICAVLKKRFGGSD